MRADLTNYAGRLRANLSQHEQEVARNKAEIGWQDPDLQDDLPARG
jgi:hypothetical protein